MARSKSHPIITSDMPSLRTFEIFQKFQERLVSKPKRRQNVKMGKTANLNRKCPS